MSTVLVIPSWWPSKKNPQHGIFFRDQCIALSRAGERLAILHPCLRARNSALPASQIETTEAGLEVTIGCSSRIPRTGLGNRRALLRATRKAARQAMAQLGPADCILAFHADPAGWLAAAVAKELNLPLLLSEHASFTGAFSSLPYAQKIADAFACARHVTAPSRFLANQLTQTGWCKHIDVVPNLVDLSLFTPDDTADRQHILAAGNLVAVKNVALLIEAYAEARKASKLPPLHIAGDGPMRAELEGLAQALSVGTQVRFLGRLNRCELRTQMQTAHAFVVSSDTETFSLVVIEAMACGTPVIATRCGGPDELIVEGTGKLVPIGDQAALATALADVRDSQFDRQAIRAHALRFGAEHFVAKMQPLLTP